MTELSSDYAEVNSLRLHYLEAGEGDPIPKPSSPRSRPAATSSKKTNPKE
jgi:hypothetical protein